MHHIYNKSVRIKQPTALKLFIIMIYDHITRQAILIAALSAPLLPDARMQTFPKTHNTDQNGLPCKFDEIQHSFSDSFKAVV